MDRFQGSHTLEPIQTRAILPALEKQKPLDKVRKGISRTAQEAGWHSLVKITIFKSAPAHPCSTPNNSLKSLYRQYLTFQIHPLSSYFSDHLNPVVLSQSTSATLHKCNIAKERGRNYVLTSSINICMHT